MVGTGMTGMVRTGMRGMFMREYAWEFGAPVISETKEGERKEIYTFYQGYTKWQKVGRTFWHSAADVATIGLWEVIGTPTEVYFSGKKLSYEVTFDAQDRVKHAQVIQTQPPVTEEKVAQPSP